MRGRSIQPEFKSIGYVEFDLYPKSSLLRLWSIIRVNAHVQIPDQPMVI